VTNPGQLYQILPRETAGAVTTVASNLGGFPTQLAFDGGRIWTANQTASVSIVTPGAWTVTTVTTGFSHPLGVLFDGANVWVTDYSAGTLLKLDSNGAVLQTVTVGLNPYFSIFDGANIWVPNNGSSSVSVVRASTGSVLTTLTGNGLNNPIAAAFDGVRILVTIQGGGGSVSLWKAADLSAIGNTPTGGGPWGACSDGVNFWVTVPLSNLLARY
jgi:hypothetical protein